MRETPQIHLCADIRHTLGASEYAFLSFLALVLRARQELRVPIVATIPTSLGGLHLGMLFTTASLSALESDAQIALEAKERPADSEPQCDHEHYDIRVTDKTWTQQLAPELVRALPPLPRYNIKLKTQGLRPHPGAFYQQIWDVLKAIIRHSSAPSIIRVSLSLLQATFGPLSHASMHFHVEALRAVRTLQFSSFEAAAALPPPKCAYAFIGLLSGLGDLSASLRVHGSLRAVATEAVRVSRRMGLGCLRLNAVIEKAETRRVVRNIFDAIDGDFELTLVDKHNSSTNTVWHGLAAAPWEPSVALHENLREHYLASVAPLLISQVGTMWSDWLLAKRTADGLPSAVLRPFGELGGGHARSSAIALHCEGGRCDGNLSECTFYRGRCVPDGQTWLQGMSDETVFCLPRWQSYILWARDADPRTQSDAYARGRQHVAVLGC